VNEYGNELPGSIKGREFLEYVSDYQLLKDSAPGVIVVAIAITFAAIIIIIIIIFTALHIRCGYEVPGMILLQAFLYTYSLLRWVTFKVLPLSSYELSPIMLPRLETFLEILLWIVFSVITTLFWMSSVSQNLRPFKAHFIFGNNQKSFGA
jgi:hypothetical protein